MSTPTELALAMVAAVRATLNDETFTIDHDVVTVTYNPRTNVANISAVYTGMASLILQLADELAGERETTVDDVLERLWSDILVRGLTR